MQLVLEVVDDEKECVLLVGHNKGWCDTLALHALQLPLGHFPASAQPVTPHGGLPSGTQMHLLITVLALCREEAASAFCGQAVQLKSASAALLQVRLSVLQNSHFHR